ncbi:MAG: hypothetical protein ACE5R6_01150 [Candidatus Heimdallarchaeota archaeon]
MSFTENSFDPSDEAEIKKEALKRTILTIEALDKMCRRRNCDAIQVDHCSTRENVQKCIIQLTSDGFTVTEIQCNLGRPSQRIDPRLWETICHFCVEYLSEHAKQNCQYRKSAEKIHHSLAEYGFAIIDLFCQRNPLRKRFKMP